MKRRSGFIFIIIICLTLIGCNEKSQVHVDGKNYKEMYESNLSEVEQLKIKIAELKNTNENLKQKLNDLKNVNPTIKKLENDIEALELIIEKKELNMNKNEAADVPSVEELRVKVYEAAKIYQDYFFLSHLKHHDDIEKMQSDIYKLDNKMDGNLEGYYLVTEENIKNLSDFISRLEEYYTKKAIHDF
ncbi:MAG: hypothetical protein MJA31_15775, partial [Clostridia bacterium]|nr:hypothetical protein [Clostridia bacterium]